MARLVALARGMNVGGKNCLKMARLVEIFERAGAREVSTYIQSGNVLFSSKGRGRSEGEKIVAGAALLLEKEENLKIPFVIRTLEELSSVAGSHPFVADEDDERMLSVGFLSQKPEARAIQALDPDRSPGDRFLLRGAEVYFHTPNGMGKSKLTVEYFDRTLGVMTTVRNLRTVRALLDLG